MDTTTNNPNGFYSYFKNVTQTFFGNSQNNLDANYFNNLIRVVKETLYVLEKQEGQILLDAEGAYFAFKNFKLRDINIFIEVVKDLFDDDFFNSGELKCIKERIQRIAAKNFDLRITLDLSLTERFDDLDNFLTLSKRNFHSSVNLINCEITRLESNKNANTGNLIEINREIQCLIRDKSFFQQGAFRSHIMENLLHFSSANSDIDTLIAFIREYKCANILKVLDSSFEKFQKYVQEIFDGQSGVFFKSQSYFESSQKSSADVLNYLLNLCELITICIFEMQKNMQREPFGKNSQIYDILEEEELDDEFLAKITAVLNKYKASLDDLHKLGLTMFEDSLADGLMMFYPDYIEEPDGSEDLSELLEYVEYFLDKSCASAVALPHRIDCIRKAEIFLKNRMALDKPLESKFDRNQVIILKEKLNRCYYEIKSHFPFELAFKTSIFDVKFEVLSTGECLNIFTNFQRFQDSLQNLVEVLSKKTIQIVTLKQYF